MSEPTQWFDAPEWWPIPAPFHVNADGSIPGWQYDVDLAHELGEDADLWEAVVWISEDE